MEASKEIMDWNSNLPPATSAKFYESALILSLPEALPLRVQFGTLQDSPTFIGSPSTSPVTLMKPPIASWACAHAEIVTPYVTVLLRGPPHLDKCIVSRPRASDRLAAVKPEGRSRNFAKSDGAPYAVPYEWKSSSANQKRRGDCRVPFAQSQ